MNHGDHRWWSFHDVNASDFKGCGGLMGPTAVIVSEETPPSKPRFKKKKEKVLCRHCTLIIIISFE